MPSQWILALLIGAIAAFGPVTVDTYLPAFPAVARDLGASPASVQATFSIFLIGLGIGQIIYGPLSDRYGRRGLLISGTAVYVIASIGCALAPTIEMLWLGRLAQSAGACAGMVIGRAAVRDLYSGDAAARMFSYLIMVVALAPIVAPSIGGQLLVYFGWRGIFWALAAFGAAVLIVIVLAFPETLPQARRTEGGLKETLANFATLFADRRYTAPVIAAILVYAGMFAYIVESPFLFIERFGIPAERYGLLFGANALGIVVASRVASRLIGRVAPAAILRAGLVIYLAAAFALALIVFAGAGGLIAIAIPLFFCVSMVGVVPASAMALALEPYERMAGTATALFGSVQFLFGAFIGALAGFLHDGTPRPMAWLMLACAAGAAFSFWLLSPRRSAV
jgi:DHA1 family bicyclomycin/chloramphenicol resistance-like MFS transporter